MKLKTFFGNSLQDAMRQAKAEFGEDVILLDSRRTKQDDLTSSKSNLVEITVTLDNANSVDDKSPSGKQFLDYLSERDRKKVFQTVTEKELEDEVVYLRHELKNLNSRFREVIAHKFSGVFLNVYGQLLDTGISPDHAASYVRHAFLKLGQNENIEQKEILKYIQTRIVTLFNRNSSRQWDEDSSQLNIIVFVGPSGSGKTTALMKMAMNSGFFGSKNVALLSTDTYSLAAFEPLKVFSKLTDIPFYEVRNASDVRVKIEKMKDIEVVLVDMPGRNMSTGDYLQERKEYLSALDPTDVFLVMSATNDLKDMCFSVEQYLEFEPTSLVFTKLDETRRAGKIISMMEDYKLPFEYFSDGQLIPESMKLATPENVWAKMMNTI